MYSPIHVDVNPEKSELGPCVERAVSRDTLPSGYAQFILAPNIPRAEDSGGKEVVCYNNLVSELSQDLLI